MKISTGFFLLIFAVVLVKAQPVFNLPGYTGYAVPAGTGEKRDMVFDEQQGVVNWLDPKQSIHFFFYVNEPGKLLVSITPQGAAGTSPIKWRCNQQQFIITPITRPGSSGINAGSLSITRPGFYEMIFSAVNSKGTRPGIKAIHFKGKSAATIHAHQKPRRNAASVHLRYPLNDSIKAVGFYNEVTVPKGYDQLHSFFMACGFGRGYFGMQVNSPTERRIIFSVWDSGNEPVSRHKVQAQDRVGITAKGEDVVAESFGNEGTGAHSHWVYNWKPDTTYRFYITALPDSNTTFYSAYFFVPELQQWKMVAAFKAPNDGKYLNNLYSFVENFEGENGQLERKALFGKQFVQNEERQWKELNQAIFSCDATGTAGDRIDYDAGVEAGQFYLVNGGFKKGTASGQSRYERPMVKADPIVDLYKNADSSVVAAREHQEIFDSIIAGKLDTTGSVKGVYYKILKLGQGKQVALLDTVVAFYQGAILNGGVIDGTDSNPATFALNRLIRGWQVGVPMCRVGGKIRLIIPSALAYSMRTRSPKIPPNSILVFDIEVLETK